MGSIADTLFTPGQEEAANWNLTKVDRMLL